MNLEEDLDAQRESLQRALLRLSSLEQRIAAVEIIALGRRCTETLHPEDPMSEQTPSPIQAVSVVMPIGWRANDAIAKLLAPHTLLVVLCAALYGLESVPELLRYVGAINFLLTICAGAAGVSMISFKTPTEQAQLAHMARAGVLATSAGQPLLAASLSRIAALFVWITLGLAMGCAGAVVWSNCTLGSLPAIAQQAIPTITLDLEKDSEADAISSIEQIGFGLIPSQISCIVQAIEADEEARATKALGQRSARSINLQRNAQAYLRKHPAACSIDGGAQ